MKMFLLGPACALALALIPTPAHAANQAALDDVMKLHNAGLGDDTVLAFIRSKGLNYEISADDAIRLRDRGLSAPVISAMLTSSRPASAPLPLPAAVPTPSPAPAPTPAFNSLPASPPTVPSAPQVAYVPPNAPPVVTPAPVVVSSPAANPDVAYFHQELSPHGRWFLVEDNRWCWQPTVVIGNPDWRPYWDRGHWVNTDHGWYWASDYSWGWAAFHYGRWHLHPRHGWIWFPDRAWASAWVVWRSGGDYCGWAPLPPGAHYDHVNTRLLFNGQVVGVNFDFGLGWQHFNFTYLRELGETPRRYFVKEHEVRTVFTQTTIVNNYTINRVTVNNTPQVHVINRGVEPLTIPGGKAWSTQVVKVQEMQAPPPNRAHEHYNRDAHTLDVYRPRWGWH